MPIQHCVLRVRRRSRVQPRPGPLRLPAAEQGKDLPARVRTDVFELGPPLGRVSRRVGSAAARRAGTYDLRAHATAMPITMHAPATTAISSQPTGFSGRTTTGRQVAGTSRTLWNGMRRLRRMRRMPRCGEHLCSAFRSAKRATGRRLRLGLDRVVDKGLARNPDRGGATGPDAPRAPRQGRRRPAQDPQAAACRAPPGHLPTDAQGAAE